MMEKTTSRIFGILLLIVLHLGMVGSISKASFVPVEVTQALDKVEPAVLEAMSTKGSSDFVIEMAEHADLKAAYQIKDWSERGWYVYKTLKEVADRTQKPIILMLEQKGIKYQSFFAGNEIAITAGEMTTLSQVAALDSVEHIRSPRTAYIDPIPSLSKDLFNFTINSQDWGITDTNADEFWSTFGIQGDGIVVANIDTGVQWDHPALDQAYKCGTNPSDPKCWYDPSNVCGGSMCDNNGHGTHTMGTMVGDDDPTLTYQVGMAPSAQWIACKGCESNSCSEYALKACADWILAPNSNPDNRPNIVNNSWGDDGGDHWYLAQVKAWRAAGIFPAFSVGNDGPTCGSLGSPGDYQESFGSAAHGSSRTIASFSSRGPGYFGDDPYTKPNISAPGVSICSSMPSSGWNCGYSGTSMASPHSAGAVALLWSCNRSLIGNMEATFEVLQNSADTPPAGTCGAPADGEGNYTYGYGYLNVLAAGQQVCSAGTITGTVKHDPGSGGIPIEGVTVTADNGEGVVIDTETRADGVYELNLPEGIYTVTASKYGYIEDQHTDVEVVKDQTVVHDFYIQPLPLTIVSGVVYDAGVDGLGQEIHGYPLYASIHITAPGFDQTIYSDPISGEYAIELVSYTEHNFEVESVISGYDPLVETITPTDGNLTHDIGLGVDGEVCSAPGYQPDYDFFWSFEQSDGGFTPGGTTSFAWGDFNSGPGEGHSGTKGIATNPAGNYNINELGYMLSPIIDLSGFGTDTPAIQWWDWKDIESASYDWARVDVTKDGGTTWSTVWGPVGGVHDTEYHQQTVALDPSYNVSNFQFRFYFKSDFSVQYAGWYIDDIGITTGSFVSPPCAIIPGGAVAGYVTDEMTGEPLVGADVYSETAATVSFVLEDDPDNAGIYWLFQPTETDQQDVLFTASKNFYADLTASVRVVQNTVTQQDFALHKNVYGTYLPMLFK